MKVLFILLTVLKILGLIIAGILALILLILAVVLFVPIRYSGRASYKKKPDVTVKISYLLHVLSVKFDFHDGDSKLRIKIFGITLGKKKPKKSKKKKVKKRKNSDDINKASVQENNIPEKIEVEEPKKTETPDYVTYEDDDFGEEKENKTKKGIFKNLKDKYNNISAKIKNISNEINDESNKRALRVVLGSAAKVLKHIKPKHHEIMILFGTGDPATTGEFLGVAYSMAFLIGINMTVTPDFEDKIFELDSTFKGRIRLFTLGVIALKAYRNKEFKNALHKFI